MKALSTIITVCFVVIFSGIAYFTTEPKIVVSPSVAVAPEPNITKIFPLPPPGGIVREEGSGGYKSLPTKEPRVEEKKPYTEPAPPPPPKEIKPIPVPEHTAMVKDDITNNEYFRGAVGAVIGWIVKNICEILLGLIKKLSFIKNLGW